MQILYFIFLTIVITIANVLVLITIPVPWNILFFIFMVFETIFTLRNIRKWL